MSRSKFPVSLKGRLIVSCQASPGDPLDDPYILRKLAASALRGGAAGLRANGTEAISAFRKETALPILGIDKQYRDGAMCITPGFEAARSIVEAGADVVALDCTVDRPAFAEPWAEVSRRVQAELGKAVLADIATYDEAVGAAEAGVDAVATTLYGFTRETAGNRSVHWKLVERLTRDLNLPVVVEGHITQPEEVRRAIDAGAFAVVVGSAITRPESITARFVKLIS